MPTEVVGIIALVVIAAVFLITRKNPLKEKAKAEAKAYIKEKHNVDAPVTRISGGDTGRGSVRYTVKLAGTRYKNNPPSTGHHYGTPSYTTDRNRYSVSVEILTLDNGGPYYGHRLYTTVPKGKVFVNDSFEG